MATKLYATATLTGNTALLSTSATTATTATKNAGRVGTSSNTWLIASGAPSTSTHPVTSPSRGAQWKVTTLSGQTVPAGKWTLSFQVKPATTAAGTLVGSWKVALFRKNGATNTNIGTLTKVGGTITSGVFTTITVTGTLGAITFAVGTQLAYLIYFTGHSGTASTGNTKFRLSVGGALQSITFPFTPAVILRGLVMPFARTQIALTGTIFNPSNWVDIGPFVSGINTVRGKQHELDKGNEPGELQLGLINTDGRFSPWSTNSPYYNQLSATDSSFTTGTGTWTFTAATGASTSTKALYGTRSLLVVTTGATGSVAAKTAKNVYAVTPGRTYNAILSVQALAAYTACKLQFSFFKSTGLLAGTANTSGSAVASHTGWTQYAVRGVAPATAAFARLEWIGTSTGLTQQYWLDCAGLFDVTYVNKLAAVTQGWNLGHRAALNPAQPVRIFATWTSTTHPVFMGIITSWVPAYSPLLGTMAVTAYDYMKILAGMSTATSTYAAQVRVDGAILQWRLGTAPGEGIVYDTVAEAYNGVVGVTGIGGIQFGAPGALKGTEGTSAFIYGSSSGSGTITGTPVAAGSACSIECLINFKLVASPLQPGSLLVGWGSGASHMVGIGMSSFTKWSIRTGATTTTASTTTVPVTAWTHLVVTKTGNTLKLYVNSVLVLTTTSAQSPTAHLKVLSQEYEGDFQEVALYNTCLSATKVATHYTLFKTGLATELSGQQIKSLLVASGVPATVIGTIATGTVECLAPSVTAGQTQLLSTVQAAEAAEQGSFYCAETGKIEFVTVRYLEGNAAAVTSNATFANDLTPAHYRMATPPIPGLDDQTLFNTIPVSVQGSTTVYVAQTATSQVQYGRRSLTGYTGMLFATAAQAQRLATYLIVQYAKPRTRVRSLTIDSVGTAGKNLPQMLGRKLHDAITVRWQPMDGSNSPFVQVCQIEQITHTVTKAKWTTTWALVPITPWFILNHSVYGVLAGAGSTAANRLGV